MVAKISHGESLYGALAYNHEKVFQGTAEIPFRTPDDFRPPGTAERGHASSSPFI